ncbi:hypothetical protein C7413_104258 [Paraburkholderia silvatlantica]|nr:hypothetical protein C7411_10360 [Paraburkholderia silvatlantica]PXW40395.1 hypothetical protein C7413_104258 [Paraburkholderia silvatlantica]
MRRRVAWAAVSRFRATTGLPLNNAVKYVKPCARLRYGLRQLGSIGGPGGPESTCLIGAAGPTPCAMLPAP